MKVNQLTQVCFQEFGILISAVERKNKQNYDGFDYCGDLAILSMGYEVSASLLFSHQREIHVTQMEVHRHTSEMCVALCHDCIIFVATDFHGTPSEDNLKAFLLKQGDTIIYHKNIWHWVPFAVNAKSSTQLIVYQSQTGKNDLLLKSLLSPVFLNCSDESNLL